MYAILCVMFFIISLFVIKTNISLFIGLMIISALFAIAAGISAIYACLSDFTNAKNQEN